MLTPTTFFVSIMMVISCFKVFDVVNIMTDGGPGRATKMLVTYIYQLSFTDVPARYGQASAVAMILFAVVLTITVAQFQAEKKWVNYM
jgi:multiple sugar transport system permease protein